MNVGWNRLSPRLHLATIWLAALVLALAFKQASRSRERGGGEPEAAEQPVGTEPPPTGAEPAV